MSKKVLAIATAALCLAAAACSKEEATDATASATEKASSAVSSMSSSAKPSSSESKPAESSESEAPAPEAAGSNDLVYTVKVEGSPAQVTYFDENAAEQNEEGVTGDWSKTVTFADVAGAQGGYLGVEAQGNSTVSCKIEFRGQVLIEDTQSGDYAFANCPIVKDLNNL